MVAAGGGSAFVVCGGVREVGEDDGLVVGSLVVDSAAEVAG